MSGYTAVGSHTTEPVLERTLLLKQEAHIFKIPPSQMGNEEKGWMATGWNLDKPDWSGKLKVNERIYLL